MARIINSFSRRVVAPEGFPGTIPRQADVLEKRAIILLVLRVAIVPVSQDGDDGRADLSLPSRFLDPVSNGLD